LKPAVIVTPKGFEYGVNVLAAGASRPELEALAIAEESVKA